MMNGEIEKQFLLQSRQPKKKWPCLFWFMMRVLALFYHKSVVNERKCFSCCIREVSDSKRGEKVNWMDASVDFYLLAYESDSSRESMVQYNGEEDCDVCKSLWWNCYRMPEKYTEDDIGLSRWSRRWNGVISLVWLFIVLTILLCGFLSFFGQLFGKAEEVLKLIQMLTLYMLLSVSYIFILCSKIRSFFKSSANRLFWTTTLNVRYLVKRAQILDMPNRGLPGVPFLVLCTVSPIVLSTYRMGIFLIISNCDISLYSVVQSLIGVVFMVNWGFSVYLIYIIRVSFQCQFKLLTSYIKEFEEDVRKCKAMIIDIAVEFACYEKFCATYSAVNFPVIVIAVVVNITLSYVQNDNQCVTEDEEGRAIALHVQVLAYLEISMAVMLSALAMGGYKVRYIWESFVTNIVIMKSRTSKFPRKELFHEAESMLKDSDILLTTLVFSVAGLYMGFKFGDQNVDILHASCNGTATYFACT